MSTSGQAAKAFKFPLVLPFDAPDYLMHLLAAVARYRDAKLDEALAPLGLSVARYRALNAVVIFETCQMGELAEFIGVDRTTMTRTVDPLVERRWVERATPANDRRQVLLSATQDGADVIALARPIVFGVNRLILEGVPETTQRAVIRAEQRMFANLAVEPHVIDQMLTFRRPARP